jgi:ubiquinone/menaquinone biosynthesis C-methylase UbiE
MMRERFDAKTPEVLGKWYDMAFKKGDLKMSRLFYNEMLDHLEVPFDKSLKLLDIACGNGHLLHEAEKRVASFGMDISRVGIARAGQVAAKSELQVGIAENLPYANCCFDYVVCLGSLEHFLDMQKALQEMHRVVKKNGRILLLVPNNDYLVFKVIGKPPLYQVNERWMSMAEWKMLIAKYLVIKEAKSFNTHWFFKWIPIKYCCHFAFICVK